eukprot:5182794-Pleurochrysis_carterae.AAC.1
MLAAGLTLPAGKSSPRYKKFCIKKLVFFAKSRTPRFSDDDDSDVEEVPPPPPLPRSGCKRSVPIEPIAATPIMLDDSKSKAMARALAEAMKRIKDLEEAATMGNVEPDNDRVVDRRRDNARRDDDGRRDERFDDDDRVFDD